MNLDVIIISSVLEDNLPVKEKFMPTLNGRRLDIVDIVNFLLPKHKSKIIRKNKLLNGIYLKDYLRRKNISSEIINMYDDEKERLKKLIEENPSVVVAISTTFILKLDTLKRAVDYIKSIDSNVVVILGGQTILNLFPPHIPTEQIKCKNILKEYNLDGQIDFIIRNADGEMSLFNIIHNLKNKLPTNKISNMASRENDFFFNPYEEENNDFENYAIRWNEFDEQFIDSHVYLMTGKGCPYKCKFCTFWKLGGRKLRYKNLETIHEEFSFLSNLKKVNSIRFIDDTFTLPVKRFQDICGLIINGGFSWNWSCYARATSINEESVKLMKEAGCDSVFLGLESGSNKMLELMGKKISVESSKKAIGLLRKYNILSYGYFICGYPGETDETIGETIDFLNTSGLDSFSIYRFYSHPLMTVYEEWENNGLQGTMFNWKHNTMDSEGALEGISRIINETKASAFTPGGMEVIRPLFNYGFGREEILKIAGNINLIGDYNLEDYNALIANNSPIENIKKIINNKTCLN